MQMMGLYYVKAPLWGVPAGRVERFAAHKAAPLVIDGAIEEYDPKRHAGRPGAPDQKPGR